MPIYEYLCAACGQAEERIQGFSAPDRHDCAHCGAPLGMERRVSRTAFVLSGGGWYASGYGAPPPDASKGAGQESSAPAQSSMPSACGGGCACHAPSAPPGQASGNT
jgi:putative FmdB family regulatory protein